jgi:hypothetical protein
MQKPTIIFPQYGTGMFPYIWAFYQGNERSFDHAITMDPNALPKQREMISFDWIHGARLAAFFVANMPEPMLGIVEDALYNRRRNQTAREPTKTLDIAFEHIERMRDLANKISELKGFPRDRDQVIRQHSALLGSFVRALCDELDQLVQYAEKHRAR